MANVTIPELPNPFTPLAFLSPELAWQTTMLFYASIGSLAVYIWDFLNNLGDDYKLVTKYRVNFQTVVYLLARWSSLTSLLADVVMSTAAIGNCRAHGLQTGWIYPVAIGATALLLVFRVRSVYNRNNFVTGLFVILWLGVLGGTATIPLNTRASAIGTTRYCSTNSTIPRYVSASGVLQFVFDAAVYVAITWRLGHDFYSSGLRSRGGNKTTFTFKNLLILSRALVQDGQDYYLSTTAMQLMTTVLFNIYSLPLPYRSLLVVPAQVIMNIMASRVFRDAKFGLFDKLSVISSPVTIVFAKAEDHDRLDAGLGSRPVSRK